MIDVKVDDGLRIMRAEKVSFIVGDFGFTVSCDIFNAFWNFFKFLSGKSQTNYGNF